MNDRHCEMFNRSKRAQRCTHLACGHLAWFWSVCWHLVTVLYIGLLVVEDDMHGRDICVEGKFLYKAGHCTKSGVLYGSANGLPMVWRPFSGGWWVSRANGECGELPGGSGQLWIR